MTLCLPVFNIQKEKQRRRTNKLSKGTCLSHFSFFSLPFIFFQIGTRYQKSKAKNYFCFTNIDVRQEYVSPVKVEASDRTPLMFGLWGPSLAIHGNKLLIHSKELGWTKFCWVNCWYPQTTGTWKIIMVSERSQKSGRAAWFHSHQFNSCKILEKANKSIATRSRSAFAWWQGTRGRAGDVGKGLQTDPREFFGVMYVFVIMYPYVYFE